MLKLGLIAVGGALGALLRYGLSGVVQERSDSLFPVGTLAVNVTGCFAIGLLAALFAGPYLIREEVRAFAFVGVLGAFTTFSTYGLETVGLATEGALWQAGANVAASNVLGVLGVWLGYRLMRAWVGL